MIPDLQKLRRFSLALGVILFSFAVMGLKPVVTKEGETRINLPLIDFRIDKPNLIPIGIALGSAWGMVLYWYYGLMIQRAPWRHRREILSNHKLSSDENYSVTFPSEAEADHFLNQLSEIFPRFLNRETITEVGIVRGPVVMDDRHEGVHVVFGLSGRQRFAAWFQDFDFYSPIWVNTIALGVWFYSVGWLIEAGGAALIVGLVGVGIYKWSERPPRPIPEDRRAVRTPDL